MKIEFIDLVSDAGLNGFNFCFELEALTVLHDPLEALSGPILSALAGQSEILGGKLLIDGIPLADTIGGQPLHRVFGYIFDEGIMLANLSLRENLLLPLRWQEPRLSDEEFEQRLLPWKQLFDLRVDLKLRPAMVKPAVRKYLSYIRSLLLNPAYLLIDDPYYLLNKYERGVMYQALSRLRSTHRMLIASSDDDFTGSFSSNCLELADLYPTD